MRLEITRYTDWDGTLAAKWCDSTQAKRAEERGGTPVGREIPGLPLNSESGAKRRIALQAVRCCHPAHRPTGRLRAG